jgi:hypothetical protein
MKSSMGGEEIPMDLSEILSIGPTKTGRTKNGRCQFGDLV